MILRLITYGITIYIVSSAIAGTLPINDAISMFLTVLILECASQILKKITTIEQFTLIIDEAFSNEKESSHKKEQVTEDSKEG